MKKMSSPKHKILESTLWGDTGDQQKQIFALLDCARDERIHPELIDSGLVYNCLYPGILSEGLAVVAPYLVKLDPKAEFTQWVITEGWGNSWGVYLAAEVRHMFDLIYHFRQLMRVRDERGKIFYFRFYDPRILRVYLPTCTKQELHTVFGDVNNFYVEDETGERVLDYRFDGKSLNQRKMALEDTEPLHEIENQFSKAIKEDKTIRMP
jgi:hypothetical protein